MLGPIESAAVDLHRVPVGNVSGGGVVLCPCQSRKITNHTRRSTHGQLGPCSARVAGDGEAGTGWIQTVITAAGHCDDLLVLDDSRLVRDRSLHAGDLCQVTRRLADGPPSQHTAVFAGDSARSVDREGRVACYSRRLSVGKFRCRDVDVAVGQWNIDTVRLTRRKVVREA